MPAAALVLGLASGVDGRATAQETPLSAIDWLSEAVARPEPSPDIAPAPVEPVEARALDAPPKDAAGLIAPESHGLPMDLWSGMDAVSVARAIAAQPVDQLPSAREALFTVLLAELDPPATETRANEAVFLARIDKLLEFGALDRAEALLEQAGPDTPATFSRWFDVSLLTGYEDRACAAMLAAPQMAPTLPARIFCLARGGDWAAAALLLETATALGRIEPADADLIARFLDPELFAGERDLPPPDRLTPLVFKMRDATAQPRPSHALAPAFAWADLSPYAPWRAQLLAAERLSRTGAITPGRLMALYAAHRPAASGGLWDRVAAVQALDVALLAGDGDAAARALPRAWEVMHAAGLGAAFARHAAPRLGLIAAEGAARKALIEVTLLGAPAEDATRFTPRDRHEALLLDLGRGRVDATAPHPLAPALAAGLSGPPPVDGPIGRLAASGQHGAALLAALAALTPTSDPADFATALAYLRAAGRPELARRAALERVLLAP
jgi:hypothetical protein